MMGSMVIAQLRTISKHFRDGVQTIHALRDVSLDIQQGEFVALSGPSGSGKTTLLNLIGCLDRPAAGSVLIEGEEVNRLSQRELSAVRRRKIGFIFQDFNLFPALTCGENIEYALWLLEVESRDRKRRVGEVASRFGIERLLRRRPAELSRGQQQRVAVARAVVHRPRIVLGDEFTANLDRDTGAALMEFLRELNTQEQITFVYASHDPVMVALAGRVVWLRDGGLVTEPRLTLASPQCPVES